MRQSNLVLREDIARLSKPGSVGVELGVASGQFSDRLLATGQFRILYSIDAWADHHDEREYRQVQDLLAKWGNESHIIRATFAEAALEFFDEEFDFIYVDGYAHTGEDDGRTFRTWWPKLKPGGIFAGDDYAPKWPKVIQEVDRFSAELGLPITLHDFDRDPGNVWDQSPSWYIRKPTVI